MKELYEEATKLSGRRKTRKLARRSAAGCTGTAAVLYACRCNDDRSMEHNKGKDHVDVNDSTPRFAIRVRFTFEIVGADKTMMSSNVNCEWTVVRLSFTVSERPCLRHSSNVYAYILPKNLSKHRLTPCLVHPVRGRERVSYRPCSLR